MAIANHIIRGLCALALLACGGCAHELLPTLGKAEPSASITSDQDAYIVLGSQASEVYLQIGRGEVTDGRWSGLFLTRMAYAGFPENGYIVAHVKPGDLLSVAGWLVAGGGLSPSRLYQPCQNSPTQVMSVPPGKVLYFGDLQIWSQGPANESAFLGGGSLSNARLYLLAHYPALAGKLEQGQTFAARMGDGARECRTF